ncbi:arfaptin-1 isoform X1 [Petromyzon marinus]|uniref:arfaptin-1 isoform X1 n=2 Tax=Petromyzon marinus TaxID=7757 RepID=UPI003F71B9FB
MSEGMISQAATTEIPISSNGEPRQPPEDDRFEQGAAHITERGDDGETQKSWLGTDKTVSVLEYDCQYDLRQMMASGPNLNETSVVSGGYGGSLEGVLQTGGVKGTALNTPAVKGATVVIPSQSAASRLANQTAEGSLPQPSGKGAPGLRTSPSSSSMSMEEPAKGVALEKLDIVRKWSVNTYKCTKQVLSERFGRGSRTVDLQLEAQIEVLRDTKRKYESVLRLARELTRHFYQVVQTQRSLGDAFADLGQKSPELQEEFGYNAETQRLLCKNGETLLGAVNFFVSSVNTLVNKTMEDTLLTIKMYENARVEYDAYRTDLEELSLGPRDSAVVVKIDAAQQHFSAHKEKYERLRGDVAIKLKFLEENKVKVMHKQLLLFHNAISAYFAGNQQQLEQTLKQFNIQLKTPGSDKPSWLEEQ